MTELPELIEIYAHNARQNSFGLRLDLPGRDRIDMDGPDYLELGEACARSLASRARHKNRDKAFKLKLTFVVRDQRTVCLAKDVVVAELARFEVEIAMKCKRLPIPKPVKK